MSVWKIVDLFIFLSCLQSMLDVVTPLKATWRKVDQILRKRLVMMYVVGSFDENIFMSDEWKELLQILSKVNVHIKKMSYERWVNQRPSIVHYQHRTVKIEPNSVLNQGTGNMPIISCWIHLFFHLGSHTSYSQHSNLPLQSPITPVYNITIHNELRWFRYWISYPKIRLNFTNLH